MPPVLYKSLDIHSDQNLYKQPCFHFNYGCVDLEKLYKIKKVKKKKFSNGHVGIKLLTFKFSM